MINLKAKPFNLNDNDIIWVQKTLNNMSVTEKIEQLFFLVAYNSNEDYLKKISKYNIGGVMCRPMSKEDIIATNTFLQNNSKIPLLLSANLESGGNGAVDGGTKIGSEMQVSATNDVSYSKKLAITSAEQGISAGLNYNFGPVADIDFNFRNPITNTRTFGSNVNLVKEFSEAYVKETQKLGMATSPKHFPGDGVDERDQHLMTSINSLSPKEWDETFGEVYKACIDAGALTIMVGHIMLPFYSKLLNPRLKDEEIMPATLAPEILNGLLREKLGFNGMIITDASIMAGMTIPMSRKKAVPHAIASGCDMFLFTNNLEEDIEFMNKGYEDGTISADRLDEAVIRILATKASLKLHDKKEDGSLIPKLENLEKVISDTKYQEWSKEYADKAITLVKEQKGVLPISPEKTPRILIYPITQAGATSFGEGADHSPSQIIKELLIKEGFTAEIWQSSKGFEGLFARTTETTEKYDLIIYVADLTTKSNQTIIRIEWAQPMGSNVPKYIEDIPTIFISTENPYHLLDAPRVKTFINAYSSHTVVLHEIVDKLLGKSEFKGQSPVDPFLGLWDTRL